MALLSAQSLFSIEICFESLTLIIVNLFGHLLQKCSVVCSFLIGIHCNFTVNFG